MDVEVGHQDSRVGMAAEAWTVVNAMQCNIHRPNLIVHSMMRLCTRRGCGRETGKCFRKSTLVALFRRSRGMKSTPFTGHSLLNNAPL